MGIAPSHKASDQDLERLDAAARRFCCRHAIPICCEDATVSVECYLHGEQDTEQGRYLARLWKRAVVRALRGFGDSIAYGYVGWSCN